MSRCGGGTENGRIDEAVRGAKPRTDIVVLEKMHEDWVLIDATDKTGRWDFSAAKDRVLPLQRSGQRVLLETGYPGDRIKLLSRRYADGATVGTDHGGTDTVMESANKQGLDSE